MSRIQNSPPQTMIEPEIFEETKEEEVEEYKPQHPSLVFHEELKVKAIEKNDHLENYVEVTPFEDKN
jgi:hypothetical protein